MTTKPDAPPPSRIAAIDAYRGFVMLLMMGEVLNLAAVAKEHSDRSFWKFLAWHQSHVPWTGLTLHDLIQPSFSFLVGISLPFSLASRQSLGTSRGWLIARAAWRGFLLAALGIFLRSMGKPQTNFTFDDTLTQIGLGYLPLFLVALTTVRTQWVVFSVIVVGYGLAFGLYPVASDFDYTAVGVPGDWPHHFTGWQAHWNKNSNLAWAFDTWWMNLFPREKPFTHSGGGYATLSFIPTLATMILGLIAGGWLKQEGTSVGKILQFVTAGVVGLTLGWLIAWLGICPSVKRIWTPTWVIVSGGWCFLLLALFYGTIDAVQRTAWSFPLRVIGMNSIVAYCIAHGCEKFIMDSCRTHFGPKCFQLLGTVYEPVVAGLVVLVVFWVFLYWLYRQRLFVRI